MTTVDLDFFIITAYLFTPDWCAGASALLSLNDTDLED